ncbi:hypothetical protein FH972_012349 [Carpinus fangiana]|uniref:Casein kinase II subunit beta n=1 Tax=Carpinus fangiana TaxID=176857 RepID=A0A5N6R6N4_9ROSI|nr:hypothetical protein FH972_012349 [Carpinus fangiana]
MYRERGVGGSRPEVGHVVDRKQRINEALDKQLERSSPSTSRAVINGKDKSILMAKPPPPIHLKRDIGEGRGLYEHNAASCALLHVERTWVEVVKKDLINEEIMESRRIITAGHEGGAHECLYNKIDFRWKYCLNEESETDSEESDVSGSDGDDTSWISWFCNLRGNEFFCEVDDDYIQDDFNLCGLSSQVPYYDYALDLILDVESSHGDMFTEEQNELVESAAEMLYGLIHARYILTSKGMAAMLEKYKNYDFGRCPRVYCCGQPCLPVGQSDIPRSSTVKIYCPRCEDIYYPRSKYQGNIDGAYFGTTFPHLFLMTYGHLKPQKALLSYVPRVFGFKIHKP